MHSGLLCAQKPSLPLRDEVRSVRKTGGQQPLSLRMREGNVEGQAATGLIGATPWLQLLELGQDPTAGTPANLSSEVYSQCFSPDVKAAVRQPFPR